MLFKEDLQAVQLRENEDQTLRRFKPLDPKAHDWCLLEHLDLSFYTRAD